MKKLPKLNEEKLKEINSVAYDDYTYDYTNQEQMLLANEENENIRYTPFATKCMATVSQVIPAIQSVIVNQVDGITPETAVGAVTTTLNMSSSILRNRLHYLVSSATAAARSTIFSIVKSIPEIEADEVQAAVHDRCTLKLFMDMLPKYIGNVNRIFDNMITSFEYEFLNNFLIDQPQFADVIVYQNCLLSFIANLAGDLFDETYDIVAPTFPSAQYAVERTLGEELEKLLVNLLNVVEEFINNFNESSLRQNWLYMRPGMTNPTVATLYNKYKNNKVKPFVIGSGEDAEVKFDIGHNGEYYDY